MIDEPKYTLPHDSSNALILPVTAKKKKINEDVEEEIVSKKRKLIKPSLSKKKQKQLQKILERKKKRFSRIEVLDKLSKNQISQEELSLFTPVARMQEKISRKTEKVQSINEIIVANSLSGSGKKKYHPTETPSIVKTSNGPYFETDSSSSDDDAKMNEEDHFKNIEVKVEEPASPVEKISKKENTVISVTSVEKSFKNETPLMKRPATFVPVNRTEEIQENRLKLPILAMEQEIMEVINESTVVIICGETGSGKTTQIPQFLYEAGYCNNNKRIAITEPRRVAAISMSKRVAEEMNLSSNVVSYQIRYEGNATEETKIKFMTDGVLLKEIRNDFLLQNYTVVVVDEAHERSMYSDILIGLLSRIVILREKKQLEPLKLIIMSATLRVDDFLSQKLFKQQKPTVINVESRQFPVTTFFNRRTPGNNYLLEAYKKCCKIHRLLPDGGILVFVSGQKEVHTLVSWLSSTFPKRGRNLQNFSEDEEFTKKKRNKKKFFKQIKQKQISLDDYKIEQFDVNETDAADFELFEQNLEEEFDEEESFNQMFFTDDNPMICLPMYSLLSAKKQSLVFQTPPPGCRLCVIATNVAETSLTIPNVKYVVDSGKEKVRVYDGVTGVSKFMVQWISKASAEQRTGRAGRTCPGKCYRLYSSAVFNEFQQFSQPEIANKPIDELVLLMKNMNILKVSNFPFPTPPDVEVLKAAEERLCKLGALTREKPDENAKITPLGKTMAHFPVSPSYAKILSLGHQQNLLPYVICLIACLSVREPLINLSSLKPHVDGEENGDDEKLKETITDQLKVRQEWAGRGECFLLGDLMVLLRAALECEKNKFSLSFCETHGLRQKAMIEIQKMRRQLTKLITGLYPDTKLPLETTSLPLPTSEQARMLRQMFLAGLAENVARKRIESDKSDKSLKNAYECCTKLKDPIFIHPTSVLRRKPPDYVLFNEIVDSNKKYMYNVIAIDSKWFSTIAESYCTFGPTLKDTVPWYSTDEDTVFYKCVCMFGEAAWNLGEVDRKHNLDLDYYRYFACALLNGEVFTSLTKWKKFLLASSSTMIKSWSRLHERTDKLLNGLVRKNAFNKKRLLDIWKNEDKKYLYEEFCKWLPESLHNNVLLSWPPLD